MKENNIDKYFDFIDLAKGFGIILVIMGHSLFPLHIAIDIFHMPLFFFLSGMTFRFNPKESIPIFLVKKIDRIFLPLLFFSIISGVLELILPVTFSGPFNGPLWFLQVIFTVIILYYVLLLFVKNQRVMHIVIVGCSILSFLFANFNVKLFFELDLVLMAIAFFHLGNIIKDYFNNIKITYLYFLIITFCGIYILGLKDVISNSVTGAFVFRIYKYSYFLFLMTSISAVFSVVLISKIISKISFINYLGKNSLVILCVHFPFIQYLNIFVSNLELYNSGIRGKIIIGVFVYCITIFFSFLCINIFKKYIPQLTGYKPLFKNYL